MAALGRPAVACGLPCYQPRTATFPSLGRRLLLPDINGTSYASYRRRLRCASSQAGRGSVVRQAKQSSQPGAGPAGGRACPVQQFVRCFNDRDLDAMAVLLSEDCVYHNLCLPQPCHGKQEVRQQLQALLAATPGDWRLVIDESTAGAGSPAAPFGQPHSVAITWHMVAGGRPLPLLSGLSFYRLNGYGQISYIKEAAEQLVKLPAPLAPLLGGAAPLLQLLTGPLAPPAAATPAVAQAQAGFGMAASQPAAGNSAAAGAAVRTATRPPVPVSSSGPSSVAAPASSTAMAPAGAGQPDGISGSGIRPLSRLEGVWLKDVASSDMASYDRALRLMQIGGLQRTTAMQLLEGLELEQVAGGDQVALRFLTVVPFFKITETFNLGGAPASMPRRDLKPGAQRAVAAVGQGGELVVDYAWDAPNKGTLREVFALDPSGRLEVTATIQVDAGREVTKQVYNKAERWQPKFTWPGSGGGLFG